jgi:hypothetical protein
MAKIKYCIFMSNVAKHKFEFVAKINIMVLLASIYIIRRQM